MTKINFDDFVDNYNQLLEESSRFFGEDNSYFAEYKIKILRRMCLRFEPKSILEYGCGIGRNIEFLLQYFNDSEIYGFDISQKSLDFAARRYPSVKFFSDFEDIGSKRFDIILIVGVFHHIPINERINTVEKISLVLDKQGLLILFEHNPYNPIVRYIVKKCPLDEEARLVKTKELIRLFTMSGLKIRAVKYTLFFPKILSFLRKFEGGMGFIPLGAQYFIEARKS